jgi:hypothetical protein
MAISDSRKLFSKEISSAFSETPIRPAREEDVASIFKDDIAD